ncbi:SDR family oxidoreductase [Poseidonocella sp. HB161398]|uniref:SDR family NAD(P)-dependent oxidoreductase n=1 Tax=Poseidonocella sp. HB161398 TaxID=2320855 RepID=UPI0011092A46|nr:SDR family NAD(P)-dependent oxidoreductase [Poseidonocella sp. HB161398]
MSGFAGQRYWVVGASEGFGLALARALSDEGAELVLSARNGARLEEAAAAMPGPARAVPVDVADPASVAAAAEAAGQIDGLVFAAGVYWPMAAAEWQAEEAETMADVNFTGALRVLGRVLPAMVARGRGHVLLTGSLTGYRGLPGSIGYTASKAGIMSLAECLACDLRGSGVRVQLANPGFIRTRLTDKNSFAMPFIMEPEKAAEIVLRHMKSRRFRRDFPRGFGLLFKLGRVLPDALYVRLFAPRGG